MSSLANVHPGEVLREEFMLPLGITQYRLAKSIGVPITRIAGIVHGRRAVTPDTALRLGVFFRTSAQFWLNLQAEYDLEETRRASGDDLASIQAFDAGQAA